MSMPIGSAYATHASTQSTASTVSLSYLHLSALVTDAEANPAAQVHFRYLGYPLFLSPTEGRLLLALLQYTRTHTHDGIPSNPSEEESSSAHPVYLSPALWGNTGRPEKSPGHPDVALPPSQIAIYVGRINRKAKAIGCRPLILSHKGKGYCLNPYM